MFQFQKPVADTKPRLYAELSRSLAALLAGETDFTANAANMCSLLYHGLPDVNWAGFYIRRGTELVLGPFQGKPACVRIPIGTGVCGQSAKRREAIVVEDVRQFSGHIACDSASLSEIVIPLIAEGRVAAVLDLDSPAVGRFDSEDQEGLESLVAIFLARTALPRGAAKSAPTESSAE